MDLCKLVHSLTVLGVESVTLRVIDFQVRSRFFKCSPHDCKVAKGLYCFLYCRSYTFVLASLFFFAIKIAPRLSFFLLNILLGTWVNSQAIDSPFLPLPPLVHSLYTRPKPSRECHLPPRPLMRCVQCVCPFPLPLPTLEINFAEQTSDFHNN